MVVFLSSPRGPSSNVFRSIHARAHARTRENRWKRDSVWPRNVNLFRVHEFCIVRPEPLPRPCATFPLLLYFLTGHEIVNDNRGVGGKVNILISELNSEGYVGGVTFMIYFEGFGAQTRCCHARGIFQRYFDDGNSIRAVASSGQRNRSDRRPSTSVYRKFIRPTDM